MKKQNVYFIPLSFISEKSEPALHKKIPYKKKHFVEDTSTKVRYFIMLYLGYQCQAGIRLFEQDFKRLIDHDAGMASMTRP